MYDIKISIILPNYNSEKYLGRCIQSFLDQDYDNKELIVVDGKSTDSSHSIIASFCSKNSSIIWVKEEDVNVTDGFNIGLKYVTGDFIGFMASDAIYFTNDIFKNIDSSNRIINFDCIHFNAYSFFLSEGNRRIELRDCNFPFTRDSLLIKMCFIPFENIFFKKNIYDQYKMDPTLNLASDIEFYYRILEKNILSFFIDKPSTINIYDGSNLSMAFSQKQHEQWLKVDIKFLFAKDELTEEKFAFHKSIMENNYTIDKDLIKRTEQWFLELIEKNNAIKFYSEDIFIKKFIPYWNIILMKSNILGIWSYFYIIKSPLTSHLNLSKASKLKFFINCVLR